MSEFKDTNGEYWNMSQSDKDLYDSLTDSQKKAFEKQYFAIQKQKEKLNAAKSKMQKLKSAQAAAERKARNHRLIQIGGIVEKYCGDISNLESFEDYIKKYAYAIKGSQSPIERREESAPSGETTQDYFS